MHLDGLSTRFPFPETIGRESDKIQIFIDRAGRQAAFHDPTSKWGKYPDAHQKVSDVIDTSVTKSQAGVDRRGLRIATGMTEPGLVLRVIIPRKPSVGFQDYSEERKLRIEDEDEGLGRYARCLHTEQYSIRDRACGRLTRSSNCSELGSDPTTLFYSIIPEDCSL